MIQSDSRDSELRLEPRLSRVEARPASFRYTSCALVLVAAALTFTVFLQVENRASQELDDQKASRVVMRHERRRADTSSLSTRSDSQNSEAVVSLGQSAPSLGVRSSTVRDSLTSSTAVLHADNLPRRYAQMTPLEVFSTALPSHIPHTLLSLDWVEVIQRDGAHVRRHPANLTFDLLYNTSRPGVFLINLDRRKDRLSEAIEQWSDTVQLLRVSAKAHAEPGGVAVNGCALSHLSVILAMKVELASFCLDSAYRIFYALLYHSHYSACLLCTVPFPCWCVPYALCLRCTAGRMLSSWRTTLNRRKRGLG
jgi:hypothetical protein